ncbi:hypothetical protein HOF92_02735 [bacterium]|jgi:hypothetical protein|nr:hypothetical protein [bacterium]
MRSQRVEFGDAGLRGSSENRHIEADPSAKVAMLPPSHDSPLSTNSRNPREYAIIPKLDSLTASDLG